MNKSLLKLFPAISFLTVAGIVAGSLATTRPPEADASSHRESPMLAADPQADATDLYAFVSPDRPDTVTLIANYYPLQVPAGGPNFYPFGNQDEILYRINVDNVGDAEPHIVYQFNFWTEIVNPNTFLYNTGPINGITDPNWNVRQRYAVTRFDPTRQEETLTVLGNGLLTPPANVGAKSTPNYEALANQAIHNLPGGIKVFAGQRDDPFFIDLGATFDLLTIRKIPGDMGGGIDALAGVNVGTLALQVPINQLTRDGATVNDPKAGNAVIGVWTEAWRRRTTVLRPGGEAEESGAWVPVSRLGMPLTNEVVVPVSLKDYWNSSPTNMDAQFLGAVLDPEGARLIKALYGLKVPPAPRDDLVAIFLTGIAGVNQPPNVKPSEQLRLNMGIKPSANPNRLGVVAGDAAGFPNGRRLGDDVLDVGLKALAGAVYPMFHPEFQADPLAARLGDGVDANDKPFLTTFPYVAHPHPGNR